MTSHETAIAERLHEAAGRIPVETSVPPTIEIGRTRVTSPSSRRRVMLAGVAVAAAAAAVALVALVGPRSRPETEKVGTASTQVSVDPAPHACPPAPGEPDSCSPAVAPHVAAPPAWFGEPQRGFREGEQRTGRWVSTAIGRVSGDEVRAPIVVSVFDGTYAPLADAETVTIGDESLRSVQIEDWRILATDEVPTVVVSGNVDEQTLRAVLDAVEVIDPTGEFSLQLRSRPDGYTELVPPRRLGPDYQFRRSLGSASGGDGIHEVSDAIDPLLSAAMGGADFTAVDVGGTTGWIGRTTSSTGPLRFLEWSPGPGIVFEIVTEDMQRTDQDLVDLALVTSSLDPAAWDALDRD
jgi:hypothetical protein